jgi:PAS domain-containing protein
MTDYKDLYESAIIGLWRTSLQDGKFLTGNEKTLEILGLLAPENLISHDLKDFIGDDEQQYIFHQLQKLKQIHDYNLIVTKPNGDKATVSISARICPEKDCVEGTIQISPKSLEPYIEKINKINQKLKKKLSSDDYSYRILKTV